MNVSVKAFLVRTQCCTHNPLHALSGGWLNRQLTAPRFHKKDASVELTVSARRGTINQEVKEARFYDNVQLIRRPDAGADILQIRTQYMQVFMDKGVARTDRAVNIVNGPSTLAGTGMEYERESGHLTLLSAVKGKFNAPKH